MTPVFMPNPPVGDIVWAASPARKIRPTLNRSAIISLRRHGFTAISSNPTSSRPMARRTRAFASNCERSILSEEPITVKRQLSRPSTTVMLPQVPSELMNR
jgi:hypothetical protein